MKTLDTNVVVRLLIGDDPQQTPIAEQAFLDAIASGGHGNTSSWRSWAA